MRTGRVCGFPLSARAVSAEAMPCEQRLAARDGPGHGKVFR